MRLRALVLGVLVVLGASASGRAQPARPAGAPGSPGLSGSEALKKEAQDAFVQGREAFKAGDHRAALVLFQKSQSMYPRLGTLFNLAACEQELGMTASAWKHFQELISGLKKDDDRLPDVMNRVAALAPRVPQLRIELVPASPISTAVSLDGSALFAESLGRDIPLDPGDHEIRVSVPGRPDQSYKVKLVEGARLVKRVAPAAEEPSASANVIPRHELPPVEESGVEGESGSGVRRTLGFIIGGVGVAGLAAGGVTGVLALTKHDELNAMCDKDKHCPSGGADIAKEGKMLSLVNTVSLAAGAGFVALGTILILTSGGKTKPPVPDATISFAPLPGGAGAMVRMSF